jgi:hypothetical protein
VNTWIDDKSHPWCRQDTQRKILKKRTRQANRGKGERTKYLLHLDIIDAHRSFDLSNKAYPQRHADHTTLFKARMHCLNTMAKRHRLGYQGKNNQLKQCYRDAYPDKHCPAPEHRAADARRIASSLPEYGISEEDVELYTDEKEPIPPKTQHTS